MDTFIPFEKARRIVLERARPTGTERVAYDEALGRTLAEPITSRDAIPPFDNSAMDGFAVRFEDVQGVPARLKITADIPAGTAPTAPVAEGACARIMTGAPVPRGADTVVQVEWTESAGDGRVQINRAPKKGANIRRAGEDVPVGQEMIGAGALVTPPVIGMMATLGYAEVEVSAAPRVAVVATGDELVEVAEALGPGQIRNANGPALAAQVRSAGGAVLGPFVAGDDKKDIRRVLEVARAADVLLISGGVSVGDYDFVKDVLDAMGMELLFWKVRQRPGKPLAFGLLEEKLVFGLPGNPVSSAMCFEAYVRPALARMLRCAEVERPRLRATLAEGMRSKGNLHHFTRGIAEVDGEGRLTARSTGAQGSHLYSSVVAANCIVHLPEGLADPEAGTPVEIEWLRW